MCTNTVFRASLYGSLFIWAILYIISLGLRQVYGTINGTDVFLNLMYLFFGMSLGIIHGFNVGVYNSIAPIPETETSVAQNLLNGVIDQD